MCTTQLLHVCNNYPDLKHCCFIFPKIKFYKLHNENFTRKYDITLKNQIRINFTAAVEEYRNRFYTQMQSA